MGAPRLKPRTEKQCPKCRTVKPLSDFYRNRSAADGRQGYCKPCWSALAKERGHKPIPNGAGHHRGSHLRRTYGITLEDYNALVALGNGNCWACNQPETTTNRRTGTVFNLAVDHDHDTDEVRGVLCFKCNTAIRSVGDDRERLLQLVRYLSTGQPLVSVAVAQDGPAPV